MNVPLLDAKRNWECPACGLQHVAPAAGLQPMHPCPKLRGLLAPFVEVTNTLTHTLNPKAQRLVALERDDYLGNELARTDGTGRPFKAVITERADGSNDCHAFAGTAQRPQWEGHRRIRIRRRMAAA